MDSGHPLAPPPSTCTYEELLLRCSVLAEEEMSLPSLEIEDVEDYPRITENGVASLSTAAFLSMIVCFATIEAEKRDFAVPVRIVDSSKDLNSYGLGNVDWKERIQGWKLKQEKNMLQMSGKIHEGKGGEIEGTGSNGEELQMDGDARLPMSCVITIPSSRMTPYRIVIVFRLLILGVFLHYRVTHPVKDAYPLWLTSVICEIWFAFSWLLDQFPKWCPINRETFLDRLALSLVLTTLCSSPSFITNLLHRVYVYRKFLKFDSSSESLSKDWFRMDIQYGKERASTWSSSSLHVASALMAEALAVRSVLLSAISQVFSRILLQSDSLNLIRAIKSDFPLSEIIGVLADIAIYYSAFVCIDFKFTLSLEQQMLSMTP
ncbi:unnamed protein product [Microthlaspi erraticum]|uniref:RNase H type-1 domain-containing protein n=1 Tax=Microthlaspi erraticum TaxID=1685480 RepID=A0A6D2KWY8_9BRAS|nr:unnamed protein product [Microthlaspi erraticum]